MEYSKENILPSESEVSSMKAVNNIILLIITVLLFLILIELKGIAFRVRTIEYNTPTLRK